MFTRSSLSDIFTDDSAWTEMADTTVDSDAHYELNRIYGFNMHLISMANSFAAVIILRASTRDYASSMSFTMVVWKGFKQ